MRLVDAAWWVLMAFSQLLHCVLMPTPLLRRSRDEERTLVPAKNNPEPRALKNQGGSFEHELPLRCIFTGSQVQGFSLSQKAVQLQQTGRLPFTTCTENTPGLLQICQYLTCLAQVFGEVHVLMQVQGHIFQDLEDRRRSIIQRFQNFH